MPEKTLKELMKIGDEKRSLLLDEGEEFITNCWANPKRDIRTPEEVAKGIEGTGNWQSVRVVYQAYAIDELVPNMAMIVGRRNANV